MLHSHKRADFPEGLSLLAAQFPHSWPNVSLLHTCSKEQVVTTMRMRILILFECKNLKTKFSPPPSSTCTLHLIYFYVFQALMSLFVLASKDGWVNIMYNGLDAVAVDQQV